MPGPSLVWRSATTVSEDLRWLLEHQAEIVAAWPARPMSRERPLKVWPDGKVRIEFVQTWKSARQARMDCERRISALSPPAGEEGAKA